LIHATLEQLRNLAQGEAFHCTIVEIPKIDLDNSVLSISRVSTFGVHSRYSGKDDELENIFAAIAAST